MLMNNSSPTNDRDWRKTPNQKTNKAPVYVSEAATASIPPNYTADVEKQASLQAISFTEEMLVLGCVTHWR